MRIYFERQDNWKSFTYDQRYLDSLASILQVQGKCAAVTYVPEKGKYWLSYNENKAAKTDKIVKRLVDLIISAKDNVESEKLLVGLYLASNYYYGYSLDDMRPSMDKFLDSKAENYNAFIKYINHLITQNPRDPSRKDLISYRNRYFNQKGQETLLQKLHEQYDNKKESSWFKDLTQEYYKILNLIQTLPPLRPSPLLTLPDKSFIFTPETDVKKLVFYLRQKNISTIDYEILNNDPKYHAEVNIKVKLDTLQNKQIKNKPEITTGINLEVLKQVKDATSGIADQDSNYIGISKLCCAVCHDYLGDKTLDHRGTHGIFFPSRCDITQKFHNKKKTYSETTSNKEYIYHRRDFSETLDVLRQKLGSIDPESETTEESKISSDMSALDIAGASEEEDSELG